MLDVDSQESRSVAQNLASSLSEALDTAPDTLGPASLEPLVFGVERGAALVGASGGGSCLPR
jgi:hypothetical protein